ncbi:hypothetical protein EV641_104227 [Rhodococcus sp. SMB37]|uniref:hypothetical protein n=1 Tax=Rhodococcus sp. SMB37 TaxID=2512213 RepID=UPI0010520FF8|nr:hypothetical protein [Rhodococcus sp. SMB37]TCN54962.1 hypothetical protein EV641_104227 [Rhodococcus sp. SMB37]
MISRGTTASFIALAAALVTVTACGDTVSGEATAADPTATAAQTTSAAPTTTTTAATTTKAPVQVDPAEYAGSQPGVYYFLSESGKFECAILTHTDPVAGCQGTMPSSAPRVPGSGAADVTVPANVVIVESSGEGQFSNIGDIAFMDPNRTAQVLPYGEALKISVFTCTIDESTGVTCESDAHGFTVSADDYELW